MATVQRLGFFSRLLDVTKIYIPASIKNDDAGQNFITNKINDYVIKFGRPLTRYILGAGGQETIFRMLTLPAMPKKELHKAILWEGNKRIPFDLNNACFGYHTAAHKKKDGKTNLIVSLIAVSRKEINRMLALVAPLNIKIDTIYLNQEAIGYMLPNIVGFSAKETYAMVDIGKTSTEISYYSGMHLEFSHTSSIGTESLSGGNNSGKTYEQFTIKLQSEIQNSLDFYAGQFSKTFSDKIFIYGDFSYSDDLILKLSDKLGLDFKRFPMDNWKSSLRIKKELLESIPPVLTSVSLAMSDYGLIEFLPPEIKEERATSRFYRFAAPALIIAAAVLIGHWMSLKYENNVQEFKLAETQNQIEQFKSSESFRLYNRIKQEIAHDKAILEKLKNNPTFLHLNLMELSRIVPKQIKLDLYDLKSTAIKPELFLSGKTVSNDLPPEVILAEFIARLENSPFFDKIEIKKYSKEFKNNQFILDFQIEMSAVI
ncbi:MAG: pilus assembly protein PilM [candidate division Zixibacteria bacterium]|nr:pilus assembly protein PilM [candidate division Zixibacteria bacterium]